MSVLFNDALDDPTFPDRQRSFRGGQVSAKPARELAEDEAAELVNCDLTLEGAAVTRRGTAQLGGSVGLGGIGGLTFYNTPAQQRLIASTLGRPYYYNGTAWVDMHAGFPSNTGRRVMFAQGINILYLADGINNLWSWDGTTPTNLGSAASNQPPAAVRWITWHTNRLCATGIDAEPNAIYFSQLLDGAVWDKTAWVVQVGADNDRITGLLSWHDFNLVVFKERSIWIVNTNPTLAPNEFTIRAVHHGIGCRNPRTAVQVGSDVFFLSQSGVRSLRRTIATEDQSEVGEALSAPVDDIIQRINTPNIAAAAATYWNNRYILTLPLDASVQMRQLVYNTLTDTWSGTWTGWSAQLFAYRNIAGQAPRLCFVKNNVSVWEWLDYQRRDEENAASYKDGAVEIGTSITTRAFTHGDEDREKTGLSQNLRFHDVSNHAVNLATLTDKRGELPFETVDVFTNDYGFPAGSFKRSFGTMHLGRFSEMQWHISATAGRIGLQSMKGEAFLEAEAIEE